MSSNEASKKNSGISITSVRIFHFRCLRAIEARLHPVTILVGENNSGKTSFLEALHGAVGSGQRQFSEDDIWTDINEKGPPRERQIIVDLLISAVNDDGNTLSTFPDGSPWLELWGSGVQQDDNDRDFVAIRTQYSWSPTKDEYITERKFLKSWTSILTDAPSAPFVERVPPLTANQLSPIGLYLLDAKRDGAEDIRAKGSIWHKLVSEPGLKDEDVKTIEDNLTMINKLFVEQSEVLTLVQNRLKEVGDVLNCDGDGVSISSVARRLRDLHKGMDVFIPTIGAPAFPLSRMGMGTRSLASVLLFKAYTSWKMGKRKSNAIHPFLAIEEPETHLHPNAQRSVFGQIDSIPGQKLISTHAPYICAQADIRDFLHFGKSGIETQINAFDSSVDNLTEEDIRHINRQVMNTRGDLLFSRYIILVEGETEEQAIPLFAKSLWGKHPHELGITVISVGGKTAYTPFLRLAARFNIAWCILSDGADADIKSVNDCLRKANIVNNPSNPKVFRIPNQFDFERYMTEPDYIEAVRNLMLQCAIDEKGLSVQGQAAVKKQLDEKSEEELAKEMRDRKTYFGARIPGAFSNLEEAKRIPPLVRQLLDFVRPPVKMVEMVNKED